MVQQGTSYVSMIHVLHRLTQLCRRPNTATQMQRNDFARSHNPMRGAFPANSTSPSQTQPLFASAPWHDNAQRHGTAPPEGALFPLRRATKSYTTSGRVHCDTLRRTAPRFHPVPLHRKGMVRLHHNSLRRKRSLQARRSRICHPRPHQRLEVACAPSQMHRGTASLTLARALHRQRPRHHRARIERVSGQAVPEAGHSQADRIAGSRTCRAR